MNRPWPAWITLWISGGVGFYVGAHIFPSWHVAVETAQVLAGIVEYPATNPSYIYHLKVWTILHQAGAALLLAGVSERTLSVWLSGLLGMVSFQALAMFVFAFTRSIALSVTAAIALALGGATDFGVNYPIYLVGTSHTYGALGLSFAVLAAALIGTREQRVGLFALGIAPAVHPSIGAWLWLIVLTVACVWRESIVDLKPRWRWFAAGAVTTVASLCMHLWTSRGVPSVDPHVAAQYLNAFTAYWDLHRQPVPLASIGVWLNVPAAAAAIIWLSAARKHNQPTPLFLLRFVTISAALSAAAIAVLRVPVEHFPWMLVVLMPGRLVNLNVMTFGALLFGLLGACSRAPSTAGIVVLACGLLLNRQAFWIRIDRLSLPLNHAMWPLLLFGVTVILLVIAMGRVIQNTQRRSGRMSTVPRHAAVAVLATAAAVTIVRLPPAVSSASVFRDWTNDAFFAAAAREPGLLATGGRLHLIQLRTRRAVLVDGGGLDGVAYALDAAPELNRILREVYEIDLLNPPEDARYLGGIPPGTNRRIWEGFSLARWQAIRRREGVTQVMTDRVWNLALPLVAENADYRLFDIPVAASAHR